MNANMALKNTKIWVQVHPNARWNEAQGEKAGIWQLRIADIAGKITEKAHVGTTTAEGLKKLFLATGFTDVQVEKIRLNWYWGIMIGQGRYI